VDDYLASLASIKRNDGSPIPSVTTLRRNSYIKIDEDDAISEGDTEEEVCDSGSERLLTAVNALMCEHRLSLGSAEEFSGKEKRMRVRRGRNSVSMGFGGEHDERF
jgi:hypothetical protein